MWTAVAAVPIDRPERWAKQLVSHFSTKRDTEPRLEGTLVRFSAGRGLIGTTAEGVLLTAYADTPAELAEVQSVLARHLERFAQRERVTVEWNEPVESS